MAFADLVVSIITFVGNHNVTENEFYGYFCAVLIKVLTRLVLESLAWQTSTPPADSKIS